jgi:hypothetical protein
LVARDRHEQALAIHRSLGDKRGTSFSLRELGAIAAEQKQLPQATAYLAECLEILRLLGDRLGIAALLETSAAVAAAADEPAESLRLCGAARKLRDEIMSPISKADLELLEARLAGARAALGEERAEEEYQEGLRMTVDDAIRAASQVGVPRSARGL